MAPRTPAACLQSVAGVTAAAAANVVRGAHRTGTSGPRVSSANLVTLLVVAGIWTVRSFVLAVRVRIELRTVAGIVDNLELSGVGVSIGVHGWGRLFLRQSDSEWCFREDRSQVCYPCRRSCPCGIRIFPRDGLGLRLYGRVCDTVSGMGTGDGPAACQPVEGSYCTGWRMLLLQAPRLDWLYYLVAGSTVIGALTLGIVFAFRPPNRRVLMLSG
jgi:hypothetical protein